MSYLLGIARNQACVVLFWLLALSLACGQIAHFGKPVGASSVSQKQFSELTSPVAAADPADAVCLRYAAGSVVAEPPALSSVNGVLEVTFQYQTTVDEAGLTRYCYVYTDSSGNAQEAPTLEVNPGDQLIIHFYNDLPVPSSPDAATHSMQGHSMQGMKMQAAVTGTNSACSATSANSGSTNLHFHGTNVAPVCQQDEVVHTLIAAQTEFDYTVQIPANEPPGAYWYHPHPHGFSNDQVIGGASGAIIVEGIQNVNPVAANLPERVFVLRDQDLPASEIGDPSLPATDLSINYVPTPYSYVPPAAPTYIPATIQTGVSEQEFWRVLNTSADTLLDLQVTIGNVPQPLQIVAVDGVPLTDANGNPTTVTTIAPNYDYLLSSAARVEFVLTTPAAGQTAQLVSLGHNNGHDGDADPARPIANIQSVASQSAAPASTRVPPAVRRVPAQTVPIKVTRFTNLDTAPSPAAYHTLYLSADLTVYPSQFYITADGQTPAVYNMDATTPNIISTEGTTEQWTVENRSELDHSFHIHQLHFQTLAINGTPVNDPTRRDTIDIPAWSGGSAAYPSVTLLMDFRDPNIVGTFVYHCHILSHEDLGMMGMIQVLPGATTTTLASSAASTPFGSSVTLTSTVAPTVAPTVAAAAPAGTVTFFNGSTALGSASLNGSGVATLTTTLPAGNNGITAAYGGATSYAGSTSPTVTVAVSSTAATPQFSPFGGVYGSAQAVTIATATVGGSIYYTTDGAMPTTAATVYTGPITVASSATIHAITVASGAANSAVGSVSYNIDTGSSTGLQFVPAAPCRVVDTRNATGPFGGPALAAGAARQFNIPQGGCGIPATAVAYSLNMTVVPNASLGYLTLWPSGQAQPVVSTLNSDGRVKANAAIVPAGTSGGVSVYATDATQVILDIDGYFVPAGTASALAFYPLTPCRIADTRNAAGPLGGPFLAGGSSRNFPVQSSSCGLPANAQAYSLNVTALPHVPLNFLTAWATGQPQPVASTLNSSTGTIEANAAIVPAGSGGDVSIFVYNDADVLLDVNGYFAPPATGGLSLYTTTPCRAIDTRPVPFDQTEPVVFSIEGSPCAPPSTASAYVLNATVVPVGSLGYLTLWPAGTSQPNVSTLNAYDGAITSNMAIVPTNNGAVDAFAFGTTNLILDLSSYFAP